MATHRCVGASDLARRTAEFAEGRGPLIHPLVRPLVHGEVLRGQAKVLHGSWCAAPGQATVLHGHGVPPQGRQQYSTGHGVPPPLDWRERGAATACFSNLMRTRAPHLVRLELGEEREEHVERLRELALVYGDVQHGTDRGHHLCQVHVDLGSGQRHLRIQERATWHMSRSPCGRYTGMLLALHVALLQLCTWRC